MKSRGVLPLHFVQCQDDGKKRTDDLLMTVRE